MTDSLSIAGSAASVVPSEISSETLGGELDTTQSVLQRARERGTASKLPYAGAVTPQEAWDLVSAKAAILIDVRTAEERQFVGRIKDGVHVPWMVGTALQRNPRFVREVESKVRRDDVLLLICRSGARSAAAAQALTESRFRNAFNVLEGFEGELDGLQQRGSRGGWRFHRLPWIQD
jgi:rhodanese-related sulfurtransferase